MTDDSLACGDLLAYRRYAYARAAAAAGDFAAAAEVLEQALERAPDWAPARFALAEARERLGDLDGAAAAYRASLAADPSDAQGAAARLGLIGRGETSRALPAAYVARLFDDYAPHFAAHLTERLAYRGPAQILAALDAAAPGRRFTHALDLGCGTGLTGAAIRPRAQRLIGVDLSPAMAAKARASGLYDAVETAEAQAFLAKRARRFDAILAADVLCYVGDLGALFAAAAAALARDGLFAFTVETFDGEGFRLGGTMRFAHAPSYVERTAAAAGLAPAYVAAAPPRAEAGAEVPGLVGVFALG